MTTEYYDFVRTFKIPDSIEECMEKLEYAIGASQFCGELQNEAEAEYKKLYFNSLSKLQSMDEETETTRKAKLEAWTADAKRDWQNMKLLNGGLKSIRMTLMQAISTKREQPINRHSP